MSAPTAPVPPAGWYEDPWDARSLRYFGGDQWTVQTAPSPAGRPLPVGPHPMPTPAQAAPSVGQGDHETPRPRDQARPPGQPAEGPGHRSVVLAVTATAALSMIAAIALFML